MQIVQRKSKDAEMAPTVHVELQQVTIPGWKDEDGQPVTSAVVIQAEAPVNPKKDGKIDSHRKTFENAWWASGCEERNGLPYLSRSAMMAHVLSKPPTVARTPTVVQSSPGPTPIALPSAAIFRRSTSRGYLSVPRSLASSSSSSIPCVAGVSCRTPPSRYRLAATTLLAVTRRNTTGIPLTSNSVVSVSSPAATGAAGTEAATGAAGAAGAAGAGRVGAGRGGTAGRRTGCASSPVPSTDASPASATTPHRARLTCQPPR